MPWVYMGIKYSRNKNLNRHKVDINNETQPVPNIFIDDQPYNETVEEKQVEKPSNQCRKCHAYIYTKMPEHGLCYIHCLQIDPELKKQHSENVAEKKAIKREKEEKERIEREIFMATPEYKEIKRLNDEVKKEFEQKLRKVKQDLKCNQHRSYFQRDDGYANGIGYGYTNGVGYGYGYGYEYE
jgi:hypothetical protein